MEINKIIDLISKEIQVLTQTILIQGGLKSTDAIVKDVKVQSDNNGLQIYVKSYLENIEKGRRAHARKIPISALIEFIKQKKLNLQGRSLNDLAFAIQMEIYKRGIAARPGKLEAITNKSQNYIVEQFTKLFDIVVENNQLKIK